MSDPHLPAITPAPRPVVGHIASPAHRPATAAALFDPPGAGVDGHLRKALATTAIEVYGSDPIAMQVGRGADRTDAWLARLPADRALILSAWNPFGRRQGVGLNDRAQSQLLHEIAQRGLRHLPAVGYGSGPAGVDERSCILDISPALAEAWLVRYRQTAAVWLARGAAPVLVWHPLLRASAPDDAAPGRGTA